MPRPPRGVPTLTALLFLTLVVGFVLSSATWGLAEPRGKQKSPRDAEAWAQKSSEWLQGAALQSDHGWKLLIELCDQIGARLSGSPELEEAVAWGAKRLGEIGADSVRQQEVMVPRWVRGAESLVMLEPVSRPLPMLGLGMSVGTGPEGIEGEVVVVSSFDDLEGRGRDEIEGRIVLFDVPFTSYGKTVRYRTRGPSAAAALGARAALVRSVTPVSLSTPHTGAMGYSEDAPKIPAAAITTEDAATLHRLQDAGVPIRVRLKMEARDEGMAPSANVIAELRGREKPDEVVVVSCHLDSWDVGQGAQDDGAGCVMAMEALRLIAALDYRPRRTVRAVLFTNEENGLAGGRDYAEQESGTRQRHVAALEADIGAGVPRGWRLDLRSGTDQEVPEEQFVRAEELFAPIQEALASLSAGGLKRGFAGADISPLVKQGVPGLGLDMDTSGYWPIHHTEADTVDKIDPMVLRRNIGVMTLTAFLLAEARETLGSPPP